MRSASKIAAWFQPTWPKTIACAFLICSFLLVEYRTPRPQKLRAATHHSKMTAKKATRKRPAPKAVVAAPVEPVATTIVEEKKFEPTAPVVAAKIVIEATPKEDVVSETPSVAQLIAAESSKASIKKVAKKVSRANRVAIHKPNSAKSKQTLLESERSEQEAQIDALVRLAPTAPFVLANTEKTVPPELEQIADQGFEEAPLLGDYDSNQSTSPAQQEAKEAINEKFPLEPKMVVVEGLLQKDDFSAIRDRLDLIKRQPFEPVVAYVAPKKEVQPELVTATENSTVSSLKRDLKAHDSTDADLERLEAEETADILSTDAAIPTTRVASAEPTLDIATENESAISDARSTLSSNEPVSDSAPALTTIVTPVLAMPSIVPGVPSQKIVSAENPKVTTQAPTPAVSTQSNLPVAPPFQEARTASRKVQMLLARTLPAEETNPSSSEPGEFIQNSLEGSLKVDYDVLKELFDSYGENWHIELHLEPADRADKQDFDTRPVENYRYTPQIPNEHFRIETEKLRGPVNLIARIFTRNQMGPVGSIPFGEKITPNYADHIRFDLTRKKYDTFVRKQTQTSDPLSLTLTVTVFEGGSADYQAPLAIPNAAAQVLVPELGTFAGDGEGNIRIQNVPPGSDLKLRVWADGYYDTQYTIVRTSPTDTYSVVYLIPKENVRKITTHITKTEMNPDAGVIMGRVYKDRRPAKDATLSLSSRKGRALFIEAMNNPWLRDILPNVMLPATTKTGLFAFFNVVSSFRSLMHSFGVYPLLLNVLPGYGYFTEFGRSPATLKAQVKDLISQTSPELNVKFVGESSPIAVTGAKGEIQFNEVGLPRGTTTLEVWGKDYDPTWHTIPIGTKQRRKTWELFVFENDYLKDNILRFSRVPRSPEKGSIIGGVEPNVFAKTHGCVTVRLKDLKAAEPKEVSGSGPYPWGQPMSGTQLCLSRQNPRFQFSNLESGEYAIELLDATGMVFRSRIFFVGKNRESVVII